MRTVIVPHISGRRSHVNTFTGRQAMFMDFRLMKQGEYADRIPDIDEDIKKELGKHYRMLETGTGRIRKCLKCGRIVISSKKYKREKPYFRNHYYCVFCRKLKHLHQEKEFREKSDRLQPAYQKIWDDFQKQLNRGIKISKELKVEKPKFENNGNIFAKSW